MALKQQHKTNKTAANYMKMSLNYDSFLVQKNRQRVCFLLNKWNDEFGSLNKEYTKPPTTGASKMRRCIFDWEKSLGEARFHFLLFNVYSFMYQRKLICNFQLSCSFGIITLFKIARFYQFPSRKENHRLFKIGWSLEPCEKILLYLRLLFKREQTVISSWLNFG